MAAGPNATPLIAIVGETASGKSALALELAEQFGGEIICADSRTVYKGMDIGTAKPSTADRARVPHHLLDVISPDEPFAVHGFKRLAEAAINDIAARGKVPFLVGGSGLYVDAVLFDFGFRSPASESKRRRVQALSVEELQAELRAKNIPLPFNDRNPRHLVRALETGGQAAASQPLRSNTLVVGLQNDLETLRRRIAERVDAMIAQGFADEVQRLVASYGADVAALQAPGYKAFREYLAGTITLDEARQELITSHLQLAKRQRTWFKRNKSIHWLRKREEAADLITTFLNK